MDILKPIQLGATSFSLRCDTGLDVLRYEVHLRGDRFVIEEGRATSDLCRLHPVPRHGVRDELPSGL